MRLRLFLLDELADAESKKMPSVAPFVPRAVVRAQKKEKDLHAKNKALAEKGRAQLASAAVSTPTLITGTESQPEPAMLFTVRQPTIRDSNTCETTTTLVPSPLTASVPPLVRGFFGDSGLFF